MTRDVDVAIIGAGQAGLASSWYLTQAGVDHVVLEAGRVAETWRSRRWDSFCLVTPNWGVELPGAKYDGQDPDGFMPLGELIDYFGAWAKSFRAPVREHVAVSALEQDGPDFVLTLSHGKLRARSVVVATGGYQHAHRPAGAAQLPRGLRQILAEDYRNATDIPPGAVLVVGSGQSGCQLAHELHQAGRAVFLACGRAPWTPRRFEGRDFVAWSRESGWLDRPAATLTSPAGRLIANVQASGNHGGRDLNYRTLHGEGVELLGRYSGADGSRLHFADDLAASVDFGDARLREMLKSINDHCAASGRPPLEFDFPEPFRIRSRAELDLVGSGIETVIWTSGYRPAYGWIKFPIFDDMGFPIQSEGCSAIPGLYFMGVPWLRKFKSSILYGVAEDAQVVTRKIIESRA